MSKNSLPNPTSRRFSSTCPLNVFKFYFLHPGLWISSNSFLQKSWGWNSSSLLFGYGCSVVPFIGKTISSSTELPSRLSLRAQDSGKSVRMWGRKKTVAQLKQSENKFSLLLPSGFTWALKGLDDTQPTHPEEGHPLCSLHQLQMLISSGNTGTTTNISPAIWAHLSPVKLAQKISQLYCVCFFFFLVPLALPRLLTWFPKNPKFPNFYNGFWQNKGDAFLVFPSVGGIPSNFFLSHKVL